MSNSLGTALAVLALAELPPKPIEEEEKPIPIKRTLRQGRNELCACDSGKKFKNCGLLNRCENDQVQSVQPP